MHAMFRPINFLIHPLRRLKLLLGCSLAILSLPEISASQAAEKGKTENVILITTDGLRWQEVFSGADPELMNKANGGVANTNALAKAFWRETPEARREALMPFFWKVIAKQGQLYGNQSKGSVVTIPAPRKRIVR